MKTRISFFVLFFLFATSFEVQKKAMMLEMLNATSKFSCAGIIGAGCTTEYQIKLLTKLPSGKITIDRFWLGKEYLHSSIKNITKVGLTEFSTNDSIMLVAKKNTNVYKTHSSNYEEEKIKIYPVPYDHKGLALISYVYNKKRRYLEVKKIKVLPPVYYP